MPKKAVDVLCRVGAEVTDLNLPVISESESWRFTLADDHLTKSAESL